MNQRRLYIAKQNDVQYHLVKPVKKKCFDAKEKWLEDQCQEIEKLSCSAKQMFKENNQIAGKRLLMPPTKCSKSEDGRILQDPEDISKRWQEYIETVFYDDQEGEDIILYLAETGPRILKNKVRWALKNIWKLVSRQDRTRFL